MRFDDSLKTVLAADTDTAFGAQSAFRQLVDLIGRRRVPADGATIERLRALRPRVPVAVRAASARALALSSPGAALVEFFAEDEAAVVAPVLRIAALDDDEWRDLLPRLGPNGRSVLRHRRDLAPDVVRALATFGATDFVIGHDAPVMAVVSPEPEPEPEPRPESEPNREPAPVPVVQPTAPPVGRGPFVSLGAVARDLPVVAEARRHTDDLATGAPRFEISDLVARIAAFQTERESRPQAPPAPAPPPSGFRWETDQRGVVRRVDGVPRGAVVGIDFLADAAAGTPQVDGVVAGAFRRRGAFTDGRLTVEGSTDAAGSWRVSGVPVFDETSGRFTGFRGTARRPRVDEAAEPVDGAGKAASESLRRLVHELRTPTNAIVGFAELIEAQLFGPVAPPYRDNAATIRLHAAGLVAAIEDLDTAARIEGGALELRPAATLVSPLIARAAEDLRPLAELRGCTLVTRTASPDIRALGDDRALERLIARLMAALVSAGGVGETIAVALARDADAVTIAFDRPASLATLSEKALLTIDAEAEAEAPGAPLLGTGFAIRLAQNLALELGGALAIDAGRLTLRLPAALDPGVGQASRI